MMIKESYLKRLRLLYVEDDDSIRTELAGVLQNFFKNVYTANNGVEGLEFFKSNKNSIDIVLSDINMPKMTGIEMVKNIRKIDQKIPIIFATAYSDTEYLFEAIQLRVYDYIIKPIDIRATLIKINDLASVLYQESLIEQQNMELERYQEVINQNNIVIKTDLNGNITYVNQLFCDTTGYELDELLGESFEVLAQNEADIVHIKDMFDNVFQNELWVGKIKGKTKFGSIYVVDCYAIASINNDGTITGVISIQRDITQELEQIRLMKKTLMKDKSDVVLKAKENRQELSSTLSNQKLYISDLENRLRNSYLERDRISYDLQKLSNENNRLKSEYSLSMKNAKLTKEQTSTTFKMGKYNTDLKTEVKKLIEEKEDLGQRLLTIRSTFEPRIEELEEENRKYLEKIDSIENIDVLNKKLDYWQNRTKDSFKRIEYLENEILSIADENTINKLLIR